MHRNLLKAENGKGKDLKGKNEIIIKIESLTKHSEVNEKTNYKTTIEFIHIYYLLQAWSSSVEVVCIASKTTLEKTKF